MDLGDGGDDSSGGLERETDRWIGVCNEFLFYFLFFFVGEGNCKQSPFLFLIVRRSTRKTMMIYGRV